MPSLEEAIILAANAHRGQKDKAGAPYILHPLRLMMQMKSETERIAAVLHDLIEDTACSLEELSKAGYSQEILDALDCLTRRHDETYSAFIDRVKENPLAVKVKLADLEDNLNIKRLKTIAEKDLLRLNRYLKAWQSLTDDPRTR